MLTKLAKRFWNDEQGLELSEYAIMAGLIICILLAVILGVGNGINKIFNRLNTVLQSAANTAGGS
jgi:Flp pilus assembly pilin Flp